MSGYGEMVQVTGCGTRLSNDNEIENVGIDHNG